jgi:hypothetical protein
MAERQAADALSRCGEDGVTHCGAMPPKENALQNQAFSMVKIFPAHQFPRGLS